MVDAVELIRNFNKDKNVIQLSNYYSKTTFMEILGKERDELAHSSFLKWLFDTDKNMGLGKQPLKRLFDLLYKKDINQTLKECELKLEDIVTYSYDLTINDIINEHSVGVGRIDLYIECEIQDTNYCIILENKVLSSEGDRQTEKYYEYFSNFHNNATNIFVYLTPSDKQKPQNNHFIHITYQDIVDFVINPLLFENASNVRAVDYLNEYVRALMTPSDTYVTSSENSKNRKTELIMAKSNDEYNLIESIKKEHNELFLKLKEYFKNVKEDEPILDAFYRSNKPLLLSIDPSLERGGRAKNSTFESLDIPIGSTLYFTNKIFAEKIIEQYNNENIKTIDEKDGLLYKGEKYRLNKLCDKLLTEEGKERTGNAWGHFIYKQGNNTYINLRTIAINKNYPIG
jgi:hypothetical protein